MQSQQGERVLGAFLQRVFDWPPLFTAAAVGVVWLVSHLAPPMPLGGRWLAGALLTAGLGLMLAAAAQMWAARTTVNPRGRPEALVTGGVFRLSRNPIYLGDLLIVLAACVWWQAPLGLLVAAGFISFVGRHYIAPEEERLRARFGAEAEEWISRRRRWL
jgi:protein-S-isoprenylcysteine O-methyltransferase Ste14